MSIQVEMPEWKYLFMDEEGCWHLTTHKPHLYSESGELNWIRHEGYHCNCKSVTGFLDTHNDSWKDSLHEFIDSQWRKV